MTGGRITNQRSYLEASDDDPMTSQDIDADADGDDAFDGDKGDSSDADARPPGNSPVASTGCVADEDGETHVAGNTRYNTRSQSKSVLPAPNGSASSRLRRQPTKRRQTTGRGGRLKKRQGTYPVEDEEGYVDEPSNGSSDGEGSLDDALPTSPDGDADADGEADFEGEGEQEQEPDGRPYALRRRTKINYAIPPPLEEMRPPPKNRGVGGRNQRSGGHGGGRGKGPGWSATGAELSRWMGGDDSDSDFPTRTPRKPFGGVGGVGGMFAGNAATGGFLRAIWQRRQNIAHLDAVLADADPLGVNQNVTFDEVGGLDDHINSLKEMTLLPLLYPEVFQRLNLTPPRGVLFHGPPGTGKTLLARALAANCRSNGKSISFFMRKGADCLSKWVGEAERQLRLLFEEARNQQPSIIFFDEIDGLAPVRSSKQDQIHASIVSTLLALMDGMDGRGQVVVIGATNRPDAIDPALRRPGRFDREFFFPLPSLSARERILQIMTRNWAGWEAEKGEANAKGLAKLTKGYGGADLRVLCVEARGEAVDGGVVPMLYAYGI
ncbi:Tat-binding 7 [Grifola frondosa]|uniref:Tat-binding 7 n=1 Tax=Grifola frondosa TaxID=5627 RepID=A0A1C7LL48_GRIFR|nr:Tat-binding 7 [Grifola frondosa]